VVGACGHSLGLASGLVSEHAACYHSCFVEEVPGSGDLATIAAHGEAGKEVATADGVRGGQQRGICGASRLDAHTVVECLSGAEGPAGSTVGLVADGADALAVGPLGA
jgi:hypothetical protein